MKDIDFSKEGSYDATIEGQLTIHNETNDVNAIGTFTVKPDMIQGLSKFSVAIADYNISIPGAVAGKIADVVDVHVDVKLKELKR